MTGAARGERIRESKAPGEKPLVVVPKKLSYLESREWDQMETKILEAETKLQEADLEMQMVEGSSDPAVTRQRYAALQAAQAEVEKLYARWAQLEAKRAS